jgi:protein SCO1/2
MVKCVLQSVSAALLLGVASCQPRQAQGEARIFEVRGVVMKLEKDRKTIVVKHEAVPNYMPAMTMPFRVKEPAQISGLRPGDAVTFRLFVTKDTSWIDQITSTAVATTPTQSSALTPRQPTTPPPASPRPFCLRSIPDFALTNELGQRVSLHQFSGQAVALTFFFTRCPIPEFCPRLSRNFAEASQKLASLRQAPTNWHLLSISFDPVDKPNVLRAYAQTYGYDSNHWSFLTGDPAQIRALTHGFGLEVTPDSGGLNHDFRTAVFDATGRLQTMWPFGGNTTELLVQELTKAAAAKSLKGSHDTP